MAINTSNYKWYQSSTWSTVATTNGGGINTTATITSNATGNTFATVSRADAVTGNTSYRKVFFKNEDLVTFPSAVAYISSICSSTYASIYIAAATSNDDTQAQATAYTWVQPTASTATDVLSFNDIATTGSTSFWLKMVIASNAPGFDANSFTITVVDTYT